jgi:hypothetical protein
MAVAFPVLDKCLALKVTPVCLCYILNTNTICESAHAGLTRTTTMRCMEVPLTSMSALLMANPFEILLPTTVSLFKVSPIVARFRVSPDHSLSSVLLQ